MRAGECGQDFVKLLRQLIRRQLIERQRARIFNRHVNRRSAVLMFLAVYGLRAREVVDLGLNDIDWRAGIIRVQRSKT